VGIRVNIPVAVVRKITMMQRDATSSQEIFIFIVFPAKKQQ
jgi:hypothetical protein